MCKPPKPKAPEKEVTRTLYTLRDGLRPGQGDAKRKNPLRVDLNNSTRSNLVIPLA